MAPSVTGRLSSSRSERLRRPSRKPVLTKTSFFFYDARWAVKVLPPACRNILIMTTLNCVAACLTATKKVGGA